jgi:hypothetical protein
VAIGPGIVRDDERGKLRDRLSIKPTIWIDLDAGAVENGACPNPLKTNADRANLLFLPASAPKANAGRTILAMPSARSWSCDQPLEPLDANSSCPNQAFWVDDAGRLTPSIRCDFKRSDDEADHHAWTCSTQHGSAPAQAELVLLDLWAHALALPSTHSRAKWAQYCNGQQRALLQALRDRDAIATPAETSPLRLAITNFPIESAGQLGMGASESLATSSALALNVREALRDALFRGVLSADYDRGHFSGDLSLGAARSYREWYVAPVFQVSASPLTPTPSNRLRAAYERPIRRSQSIRPEFVAADIGLASISLGQENVLVRFETIAGPESSGFSALLPAQVTARPMERSAAHLAPCRDCDPRRSSVDYVGDDYSETRESAGGVFSIWHAENGCTRFSPTRNTAADSSHHVATK